MRTLRVWGQWAMGVCGARVSLRVEGSGEKEVEGLWGVLGLGAVGNRRLRGDGECESWRQ